MECQAGLFQRADFRRDCDERIGRSDRSAELENALLVVEVMRWPQSRELVID
jgi:hypothetical protein